SPRERHSMISWPCCADTPLYDFFVLYAQQIEVCHRGQVTFLLAAYIRYTMFLATLLEHAAHRYPEAEAIIENGRRLTYAQWNRRVNCVANALSQLGIRPGDRVALCAANSEAMATMYFATIKLGGIAVPLNIRWKAGELAYAFADAEVRAVF